ncbi:SecY-interacting protein [Aliidiomarina celeris]|uniref:SecY-interacting protein n=1 Tax=Aliidiomarina celeris TaxID=2249428 RepID=UPI000DEB24EE|nr:SecY-interacting protein [Aliidiomarina celeris]
MSNVSNVLTELHERYQRMYADAGLLPRTDYIKEWDSPCYSGSVEGEEVAWQPIVQQPPLNFSNVEDALALAIHNDLKDFFAGFWAGDLQVRFRDLSFTLLQVQSQQDAERLQQNLIGHVLMKQRLKQNITLFFGVGIEDDLMLSMNNATGAIGLEYAGKEPHVVLAGDLSSFLREVEPVVLDQSEGAVTF